MLRLTRLEYHRSRAAVPDESQDGIDNFVMACPEYPGAYSIAGEPEPCFCALLSCCTMAVQPSGFALLSFPLRSYVRPVVPYCGRSGAVRSLGVAVAASPRQRAAAVGLGAPGDDLTNGRVGLRV